MACGQTVRIAPEARITGNLVTKGAEVEIDGVVEGDVESIGGTVVLGGPIGGSAELEADMIEVNPGARIEGDLDYISRHILELEESIVGGAIDWSPSRRRVNSSVDLGGSWIVCLLIALIVGLAAVALFSRHTRPSSPS